MRFRAKLPAIAILIVLASGAAQCRAAAAGGQKLRVVATTGIVADLARNVGGDKIELVQLVPTGSDPHSFEPAPGDVVALAEAQVILANGLGLEEFLAELLENAGGRAATVPVSTGVEVRQFGQAGEPAGEGPDPHIWTTPANAIVMVHNIERALSALDPANAGTYAANAGAYAARLAELDAWVRAQIEAIPPERRKLVTDHDAFGYYADRYGLEVIGAVIPAYSASAEPSAQELAALQDAIGQFQVKAIFVGVSVNPVLAQRLAEDSGIQLVPLYTGSLGLPGSGAETYIGYIRYNTTAIVEGLTER